MSYRLTHLNLHSFVLVWLLQDLVFGNTILSTWRYTRNMALWRVNVGRNAGEGGNANADVAEVVNVNGP